MGAEPDYKPFEVIEDDGRTILRLRGTGKQQARVEADKVHIIMDAIAKGWDIDFQYADIEDDLDIRTIAEKLGKTGGKRLVIKGSTRMPGCNISGYAYFMSAQFSGEVDFASVQFIGHAYFGDAQFSRDADFGNAQFGEYADFKEAQFSGDADFGEAQFNGRAYFGDAQFSRDADFGNAQFGEYADFKEAQFSGDANFGDARFAGEADFRDAQFTEEADFNRTIIKYPANFAGVRFRENTVLAGLWNLTLGRIGLLRRQVTNFTHLNTEVIIDGSSNPWLKRYIDDEQWINAWKKRGRLRKFLFVIWDLTSHCGRSIGLWFFWLVFIVNGYALLYRYLRVKTGITWLSGFGSYLYYSLIVFTKLGPVELDKLTNYQRVAVGAEMVTGYLMLGVLVSIFANKVARRS